MTPKDHSHSGPSRWATWAAGLLATVLLAAVSLRVPPIQSPDEISHIVRIAALSEGRLATPTPPDRATGMEVDTGWGPLVRLFIELARSAQTQPDPDALDQVRRQGWTGQTVFVEAPGAAMYPPVIYAPAAAGMALGRALDLSILQSYGWARAFSQGVSVLLLIAAARIWAPPALAWAVLLLPMSVFQMVAPVVDGLAHGLTLLVLSMFMKLMERNGPPPWWLGLWLAMLAVLVATRLHLAPLLGLPLWWALRAAPTPEGRSVRRAGLLGVVAVVVACGAWVLWVLSHVRDTRVQRAQSTFDVLVHYLLHPLEVWGALARTLGDSTRRQFLGESFIGILGWLDTRLPDAAYPLLGGTLMALVIAGAPWWARHPGPLRPADRLFMVGAGLISALLAFLLMLLTWSPFPTQLIEGVQGRYFIAPALVAAFGLGVGGSSRLPTPRLADRLVCAIPWLLVLLVGALSVMHLGPTLDARYPAWSRLGAGW